MKKCKSFLTGRIWVKAVNALSALVLLLTSGVVNPFVGYATEVNVNINSEKVNESNLNTKTELVENTQIRILEIQPGHNFWLNGGENQKITVDEVQYTVNVDQLSMPEFIGNITQLNGWYDVIVLGRKIETSSNQRDYSAINYNSTNENDYKENDITIRKANEIIDFINSGQLVLMHQDIFKDNMKNSNLSKMFNSLNSDHLQKGQSGIMDSVKKVVEELVEKQGDSFIHARKPDIEVTYEGGDERLATVGSLENRLMKYTVAIPDFGSDVTLRLYLDMNGDALFQEKECYVTQTVTSNQVYEFTYEMGEDFIGLLDWKVEIEISKGEQTEGVKSYVLGQTYFKTLEEGYKREVKVLQLTSSKSNSFDLSNEAVLDKMNDNPDYRITVSKMNTNEFNLAVINKNLGDVLKPYNMVIMGFEDSYNGNGTEHSDRAISELKYFIESGQSIMFTHDTITIRNNKNYKMMKEFRDYVGQTRFIDFYRPDKSQVDLYKEYNPETGEYEDRYIPHIDPITGNLISKEWTNNNTTSGIFGYSLNGPSQKAESTTIANGIKGGSTIYETNQGLITQYPYQISANQTLAVTATHTQYYQLNFEDPDLVPWYNLVGSGINHYDSRNNYYTYSKGNITFSGTGHQGGQQDKIVELQLFANTIIKAERGGNHKPVISASIPKATNTEIPFDQDYEFKVTAKDVDNDQVDLVVKINGEAIDTINSKRINQGELINVVIPKDLFSKQNDGYSKIEVTVEATDIQGAKAETVIYTLQPITIPQIKVDSQVVSGLVGDDFLVTVMFEKLYEEIEGNENFKLTNATIGELKYNSNLVDVSFEGDSDLIFNQGPSDSRTFKINAHGAANVEIVSSVTYDVDGVSKEVPFSIYVNTKTGKVRVELVNELGEGITDSIEVTLSDVGRASTLGSGSVEWPHGNERLTTKTYSLVLDLPFGFEETDNVLVSGNREDFNVSLQAFNLDYNNPNITFKVVLNNDLISHLQTIKILEIQPANSFKLNFNSTYEQENLSDITTSVETKIYEHENEFYRVTIERISMPEYIGKSDKANGKYDVIVLGRYVDNTMSADQVAYKDYGTRKLDNKLDNGLEINNDITERKAGELTEFIGTGQLVYLDYDIVKQDTWYEGIDKHQSILYKTFSPYLETDNETVVVYKQSEVNDSNSTFLDKIIEKYLSLNESNKSAHFNLNKKPSSDDVTSNIGKYENRNFKFELEFDEKPKEEITVSLFLDIDGDGLFKENEEVKQIKTTNQTVMLEYDMPTDFIGYLEWQVVAQKQSGIRYYEIEQLKLTSLDGQKYPIRVLQVAPFTSEQKIPFNNIKDAIKGNLNLKENERFQKLVNELVDYDIQIEVMDIDTFNSNAGNTLILNGNYDMAIFGFSDVYNKKDFTTNAIKELNEFIETGQAVMFTHDTFWYKTTMDRTNAFKDLAGQTSESAYAQSNTFAPTQSKIVYQTNDALITNYPFVLDETISIRRTHGQWYQLDLEDEDVIPWYTITPNTVTESGAIPDYSAEIPEDIINELEQNGLSVKDMENDDNDRLADTSLINPYDVKNNYYTYSVKNITFSGTAENTKEVNTPYPESELKLFVNTIAKAVRGANHAPVISVSNLYDKMEIAKQSDNFTFSTTATDIDGDLIEVTVVVKNGDDRIVLEQKQINSGTQVEITVDKASFDYSSVDEFEIEITAKDLNQEGVYKGAESKQLYTIYPVDTALLMLTSLSGNTGLIGDIMNTQLTFGVLNEGEQIIENVKFVLESNYDTQSLKVDLTAFDSSMSQTVVLNDNMGTLLLNLETFIPLNGDGGGQIKASVTYDRRTISTNNVQTVTVPLDIPIFSKEGMIKVSVKNSKGVELLPSIYELLEIYLGEKKYSFGSNSSVALRPLKTNQYTVSLNLEKGTELDGLMGYTVLNKTVSSGVFDNDVINLSYDNPEIVIDYVVDKVILRHGLYEGFKPNEATDMEKINIIDSFESPIEFVKGSIVTFGATFKVYKNETIKLDVDENIKFMGNVDVYKLVNNKLELHTQFSPSEDYVVSDVLPDTTLLLLYKGELTASNTEFENNINVSGNTQGVKVKTKSDDFYLPDLF
ncbi:MAG TPA: hypothetical protein DCY20_05290 [Firmicutes bacterium]|nr:hypothetical protein [Bacillota bacterium]